MARLIDLDKIAPPDVTVVIDSDDYLLPGDLPTDLYLGIIEAAQRFEEADPGDESADAMRDLDARVLEAFQVRQPDLHRLPIGVARIYALIVDYYGAGGEETEPDPPRAARAAASTPKRKRSSASSAARRRTTTAS